MTDQKPTGVFVPLHEGQLREDQIAKICNPKLTMTESLLAIGTPVQGGELEKTIHQLVCAGIRNALVSNWSDGVCALHAKADLLAQEVMAGKPDALAKLVARDAEIVRLQELLASRKRENFNAGYLIACCNIVNMHNEEGIASDVLAQAGITEAEVKALDLSEYDSNALTEIRKASSEDPILKGGAT